MKKDFEFLFNILAATTAPTATITPAPIVKMNRSNSFVNSLKWWPLQSHQNQNSNQSHTGDSGGGGGVGGGGGSAFRGFIPFNKTQTTFGSSVAVQKLRESKWFKSDEQRIFCAVVECGFIVELRSSAAVARKLAQQQQRRQRLLSLTNKMPAPPTMRPSRDNSTSICSNVSFGGLDDLSGKNHTAASMIMTTSVSSSSDYDDEEYDEDDLELQDENETPITTWFGIVLCKTTKGK